MKAGLSRKTIGIIAVTAAAGIWALEPVLAKLACRNSSFLQTSAVRALIAAVIGLLYSLKSRTPPLPIPPKEFLFCCLIGLIGTIAADLLYFYALCHVPVVNAVLIGHLQPVFIVLAGAYLLKEDRLNKLDYIGISSLVIAGVFVSTGSFNRLFSADFGSFYNIFVLCSAVLWSFSAILMRKFLRFLNPGVITFWRFATASVILSTASGVCNPLSELNLYQVITGLVVGLGTILYYIALTHLKAAQVSALELLSPLFAVALGFIILGELITPLQIAGIALLIFGVLCISKSPHDVSS